MCYFRSLDMSCIPPDPYRERFVNYMDSIIITSDREIREREIKEKVDS